MTNRNENLELTKIINKKALSLKSLYTYYVLHQGIMETSRLAAIENFVGTSEFMDATLLLNLIHTIQEREENKQKTQHIVDPNAAIRAALAIQAEVKGETKAAFLDDLQSEELTNFRNTLTVLWYKGASYWNQLVEDVEKSFDSQD